VAPWRVRRLPGARGRGDLPDLRSSRRAPRLFTSRPALWRLGALQDGLRRRRSLHVLARVAASAGFRPTPYLNSRKSGSESLPSAASATRDGRLTISDPSYRVDQQMGTGQELRAPPMSLSGLISAESREPALTRSHAPPRSGVGSAAGQTSPLTQLVPLRSPERRGRLTAFAGAGLIDPIRAGRASPSRRVSARAALVAVRRWRSPWGNLASAHDPVDQVLAGVVPAHGEVGGRPVGV
jgi:hypothetical protein